MFVVLALVFFVYAVVEAWRTTNGDLPSIPRLIIAGLLWCGGLLVGAFAWATLLGRRRVDHAAGLLVSQLAKYIPGGIWQAAGQVSLARSAGIPLAQGAAAFSVLSVCQLIAGASYAVLLGATWTDQSPIVRGLLAVGGLVALVLLDRRWMVWALHKIPRFRDVPVALVPPQRSIAVAYLCGVMALAATSVSYLVILTTFGGVHDVWFVVAAYAAAWTIGFIAIPIPSGVGIREAVLVGLLHGVFPASVIVAASVYQRLVSVTSEGVMAAIASPKARPRRAPPVSEQ
jgi:hypothetical protein